MVSSGKQFLKCLVLIITATPVFAAGTPEILGYRVYYKGWLSAMQELPIAEARLVTEPAEQGRLQVSTLSLSSAAHDMVDAVYPIRYRLRSVYDRHQARLLAMERFKRTRRVKHDLAWVDETDGRLHYLRADAKASGPPVPDEVKTWLLDTRFGDAGKPAPVVPAGLLDRLALLQALRQRIPAPGQVLGLPVTDGPKLFRYEARLDGSESIQAGGRTWPAWRLRVDGYEQARQSGADGQPDHAPVYVWISRDPQRLPLRFHIDHRVGGFTVEWVPGDVAVAVALDAPVPPADAWVDEG